MYVPPINNTIYTTPVLYAQNVQYSPVLEQVYVKNVPQPHLAEEIKPQLNDQIYPVNQLNSGRRLNTGFQPIQQQPTTYCICCLPSSDVQGSCCNLCLLGADGCSCCCDCIEIVNCCGECACGFFQLLGGFLEILCCCCKQ